MDGVSLVLLVLATWRVSYLLVHEGGPWNVLAKLRNRLGVAYHVETHEKEGYQYVLNECRADYVLGRLLCCLYCTSVWVAAGWLALYALIPDSIWLMWIFGISGGASLLAKGTDSG